MPMVLSPRPIPASTRMFFIDNITISSDGGSLGGGRYRAGNLRQCSRLRSPLRVTIERSVAVGEPRPTRLHWQVRPGVSCRVLSDAWANHSDLPARPDRRWPADLQRTLRGKSFHRAAAKRSFCRLMFSEAPASPSVTKDRFAVYELESVSG